jgi:hypothetical protein
VFPDLSQYCPVLSMTTYTNPVDVPNQPNPLKGFLIGCADARFSLDAVCSYPLLSHFYAERADLLACARCTSNHTRLRSPSSGSMLWMRTSGCLLTSQRRL